MKRLRSGGGAGLVGIGEAATLARSMDIKIGISVALVLLGASKIDGCSRNELGNLRARPGGDLSHVGVPAETFAAREVEACGPGGPTASARFVRTPYVQKTTTSGFELLWIAQDPADFSVEVTTADGTRLHEATARADTSVRTVEGTQYVADIEGLPAGEIVCYRVVGPGGAWTTPIGTSTAPPPDEAVSFVAMGDLGKQSPDQYALVDQLEQVAYDFVVITGDVAYDNGKRSELQRNVFEVYGDLMQHVPFFPTTGNHDYRTQNAAPFREAFALFENGGPAGLERWYSFDWGPVHVAVIDTEKLEQAQLDWLNADLAAADRPWTIVVGHRPPYSSGSHGSDKNVRELFVPIFERHGVDLVLMGHDHHYERTESIDGVVYVVTGGGGRGTRPVDRNAYTAFADDVAHFLWLEANTTDLRMVAVDATGQQFDSLHLRR